MSISGAWLRCCGFECYWRFSLLVLINSRRDPIQLPQDCSRSPQAPKAHVFRTLIICLLLVIFACFLIQRWNDLDIPRPAFFFFFSPRATPSLTFAAGVSCMSTMCAQAACTHVCVRWCHQVPIENMKVGGSPRVVGRSI